MQTIDEPLTDCLIVIDLVHFFGLNLHCFLEESDNSKARQAMLDWVGEDLRLVDREVTFWVMCSDTR